MDLDALVFLSGTTLSVLVIVWWCGVLPRVLLLLMVAGKYCVHENVYYACRHMHDICVYVWSLFSTDAIVVLYSRRDNIRNKDRLVHATIISAIRLWSTMVKKAFTVEQQLLLLDAAAELGRNPVS